MKVRTNLTPGELEHVADKLGELAKSQRGKVFPLENPAETELMRRVDHILKVGQENFRQEISRVLND